LLAGNIDDRADAACIVFELGIVKALGFGEIVHVYYLYCLQLNIWLQRVIASSRFQIQPVVRRTPVDPLKTTRAAKMRHALASTRRRKWSNRFSLLSAPSWTAERKGRGKIPPRNQAEMQYQKLDRIISYPKVIAAFFGKKTITLQPVSYHKKI
jgi:hypothetical protein